MVLNLGQFGPPKRRLAMSGDLFGCENWASGLPLACSEYRPEMLLNLLQCPGRAWRQKHLTPNVNSAEPGKLGVREFALGQEEVHPITQRRGD